MAQSLEPQLRPEFAAEGPGREAFRMLRSVSSRRLELAQISSQQAFRRIRLRAMARGSGASAGRPLVADQELWVALLQQHELLSLRHAQRQQRRRPSTTPDDRWLQSVDHWWFSEQEQAQLLATVDAPRAGSPPLPAHRLALANATHLLVNFGVHQRPAAGNHSLPWMYTVQSPVPVPERLDDGRALVFAAQLWSTLLFNPETPAHWAELEALGVLHAEHLRVAGAVFGQLAGHIWDSWTRKRLSLLRGVRTLNRAHPSNVDPAGTEAAATGNRTREHWLDEFLGLEAPTHEKLLGRASNASRRLQGPRTAAHAAAYRRSLGRLWEEEAPEGGPAPRHPWMDSFAGLEPSPAEGAGDSEEGGGRWRQAAGRLRELEQHLEHPRRSRSLRAYLRAGQDEALAAVREASLRMLLLWRVYLVRRPTDREVRLAVRDRMNPYLSARLPQELDFPPTLLGFVPARLRSRALAAELRGHRQSLARMLRLLRELVEPRGEPGVAHLQADLIAETPGSAESRRRRAQLRKHPGPALLGLLGDLEARDWRTPERGGGDLGESHWWMQRAPLAQEFAGRRQQLQGQGGQATPDLRQELGLARVHSLTELAELQLQHGFVLPQPDGSDPALATLVVDLGRELRETVQLPGRVHRLLQEVRHLRLRHLRLDLAPPAGLGHTPLLSDNRRSSRGGAGSVQDQPPETQRAHLLRTGPSAHRATLALQRLGHTQLLEDLASPSTRSSRQLARLQDSRALDPAQALANQETEMLSILNTRLGKRHPGSGGRHQLDGASAILARAAGLQLEDHAPWEVEGLGEVELGGDLWYRLHLQATRLLGAALGTPAEAPLPGAPDTMDAARPRWEDPGLGQRQLARVERGLRLLRGAFLEAAEGEPAADPERRRQSMLEAIQRRLWGIDLDAVLAPTDSRDKFPELWEEAVGERRQEHLDAAFGDADLVFADLVVVGPRTPNFNRWSWRWVPEEHCLFLDPLNSLGSSTSGTKKDSWRQQTAAWFGEPRQAEVAAPPGATGWEPQLPEETAAAVASVPDEDDDDPNSYARLLEQLELAEGLTRNRGMVFNPTPATVSQWSSRWPGLVLDKRRDDWDQIPQPPELQTKRRKPWVLEGHRAQVLRRLRRLFRWLRKGGSSRGDDSVVGSAAVAAHTAGFAAATTAQLESAAAARTAQLDRQTLAELFMGSLVQWQGLLAKYGQSAAGPYQLDTEGLGRIQVWLYEEADDTMYAAVRHWPTPGASLCHLRVGRCLNLDALTQVDPVDPQEGAPWDCQWEKADLLAGFM